MDIIKKKSSRSANFSSQEKTLLVDIVAKYIDIVEKKKTDGTTKHEKNAAWNKIAVEFNGTSNSSVRTPASLRSCYDNEKKRTRKALAEEKAEILKTGGGTNLISKLTSLQHKLLAMIPGTAESLENQFDSDTEYLQVAETTTHRSSTPAISSSPDVTLAEVPPPIEYIDVTAGYQYSPRRSNSPSSRSPVIFQPVTLTQNDNKFGISPTSKTDSQTSSTISARSTNNNLLKPTGNTEEPSASTSTQVGPKRIIMPVKRTWVPRRRTNIVQKPPVAEANLKFDKLVDAKLELVQLQVEVLKKDSGQKEMKEREGYERQKAEHEQRLRHQEDEYLMKKNAFLEEHNIKMEILKTELEIKKCILQKEKCNLNTKTNKINFSD